MINWKEIPFVRFLIPFAFGITLSTILNNNHPIWYGILLFSIFIRFIFIFQKIPYRYRLVHGIIANAILFLMGYLWCINYNELQRPNHFQQYISNNNITIGVISNAPKTGKYCKAILSAHLTGTHSDSLKKCTGNILVYLKNDSTRRLQYGDIIAFKGQIQKINPPKNPYAFNYQKYLHFQNIHYQCFVSNPDYWKITAIGHGNFISKKAIEIRHYFLAILEKHIPTPNELAVANALILGDKNNLDEEIKTAYAHTGALHVLAVSGLHVGLVAWFVNVLLNLIRFRSRIWKIAKASILIGVVWSFALISGGSPSVLRAATMFTFLIIGLSLNRFTNIYNSLGISATILLFWNPYLLMNVSFQLSYLALLGIIYFQPKIYSAWIFKNRLGRFFWKLSTVTFGAQIGTLPISLYYFHSFPFFAWLSGIIVIPAATIILGSGMLLFVLESLFPFLAFIPSTVLNYAIWTMNSFIFLIGKIPFSVQIGVWVSVGFVILMYALIGNIALALSTRKLKWLLPAAGLFLVISINYSFASFEKIQQKKIIIYHSSGNTILDFFEGKNGYSIATQNIPQKKLSFPSQNNRWANGIKKVEQLHFENKNFKTNNLLYQKPFIQFFDKKIFLVDDSFQLKNHPKINVDFILFYKNPKINIQTISDNFIFKQIIFDASNSQWKIKKWKTNCQNLNISYYDIFEKGAFVIALE